MSFPPLSYVLLVGATVVVLPFLVRRAADHGARRFALHVGGGLLLFEMGLVLLFYAKILCWPLVTAGVATLALAGRPGKRLSLLYILVPALLAGLAFELLPDLLAFYFYFGFAIPFLLLAALVPACAPWVANGTWRHRLACGALFAFGALTPASAFAFTFLVDYEIFQLPVLLAALAGLAFLTRAPGWSLHQAARTLDARATIAERLTAPWASNVTIGTPLVLVGLAVGWLALRHAPLPGVFAAWVWGSVAFSAALAILTALVAVRRLAGPALVVAALAGAVAALAGVRFGAEAFHVYIGGGPAAESTYFYLAGIGLTLLALAAALGIARVREQARRERLVKNRDGLVQTGRIDAATLPPGFLLEPIARMPTIGDLAAFRARLTASGGTGGVLEVVAPAPDLLVGLPPDIEEWLAGQARAPVVHLAVPEGREVFLVPFIDAEESP